MSMHGKLYTYVYISTVMVNQAVIYIYRRPKSIILAEPKNYTITADVISVLSKPELGAVTNLSIQDCI